MSWDYKRLGEIVTFFGGGTPSKSESNYWGGSIPWASVKDFDGDYLTSTQDCLTEEGVMNSSTNIAEINELLLVTRMAPGTTAITTIKTAINQDLKIVRPVSGVSTKYLHFYFKFSKDTISKLSSGSTVKGITVEKLNDLKILIPPYQAQEAIGRILDKAQALIDKRKEAIAKLDELIQAVFLDMFGDPVRNPKNWGTKLFGDLIAEIDSGWSPQCESNSALEAQWGVLKLSAITKGIYLPEHNKALPSDVEPRKQLEVKKGDLLFNRKNTLELVGTTAYVFDTPGRLIIPDTIFRFVVKDDNELNKLFLWQLFNNRDFKKDLQRLAGGSAGSMPNISKQKLKNINIIVPDINIQKEFASIVNKIENQKQKMQQSLTQLETNFNALLQRAFKGELTSSTDFEE